MRKIYCVHSVVPSYHSGAEKALSHAWATNVPIHLSGDSQAKAEYISQGIKDLKAKGEIRPVDGFSSFPRITTEVVR
jgi:hypothetical protein